MSEQIFWAVLLCLAVALSVWETVQVSKNPRDHSAWTGLVLNLILTAFASVCLWGLL
jgi:hypothetical protein